MVISIARTKGRGGEVITIHQPWASLIMAGAKPFEFGHGGPCLHDRGRIGIHASAQKVDAHFAARLCAELRGDRLNPAMGVAELCLHAEQALPVLRRACSSGRRASDRRYSGHCARLGAPVTAWEAMRAFDLSGEDDAGLGPGRSTTSIPGQCRHARGTRNIWSWNRTLWPRRVLPAARTHAPA
jgi:hypothetical protein